MIRKNLIIAITLLVAAAATAGCSHIKKSYDKVVDKDISLEDQQTLADTYIGRNAWTRTTLEDISEDEVPGQAKKKIIVQDTKIQITNLDLHYNGAVTVKDLKKKRELTQALDVEAPLSAEKIENRLAELMWFQDPKMRQVGYIRMWGKRAARAVVAHEVFIGMPKDAALESWGPPTEIRTNSIGGREEEQWAYRQGKKPRYVYITDGKVSKWEDE